MIGFTQPGKLIVENIKMYQTQWDLTQTTLYVCQRPGYFINLVAFNLLYSYKTFGASTMFATKTIANLYIGSGDNDAINNYMNITDNGSLQTFAKFFQPLSSDSCDIMVGKVSASQSRSAVNGLAVIADGSVTYDESLTNPYCYLSLAYYLVPSL